jgi:spore germination protein KB
MMVAGVFFKVGCWIFGASIAIYQLFKLNHSKSILLALGCIITPLSLLIATDFVEHLEIGLGYNYFLYFLVPLQIIMPIMLLCIAFVRKKFT